MSSSILSTNVIDGVSGANSHEYPIHGGMKITENNTVNMDTSTQTSPEILTSDSTVLSSVVLNDLASPTQDLTQAQVPHPEVMMLPKFDGKILVGPDHQTELPPLQAPPAQGQDLSHLWHHLSVAAASDDEDDTCDPSKNDLCVGPQHELVESETTYLPGFLDTPGRRNRPKGRAPKGKVWDPQNGGWVDASFEDPRDAPWRARKKSARERKLPSKFVDTSSLNTWGMQALAGGGPQSAAARSNDNGTVNGNENGNANEQTPKLTARELMLGVSQTATRINRYMCMHIYLYVHTINVI